MCRAKLAKTNSYTGGLAELYRYGCWAGLPYVLIFPDMSSFSRLKLPSGRNL
jgi:hypothetical protein